MTCSHDISANVLQIKRKCAQIVTKKSNSLNLSMVWLLYIYC